MVITNPIESLIDSVRVILIIGHRNRTVDTSSLTQCKWMVRVMCACCCRALRLVNCCFFNVTGLLVIIIVIITIILLITHMITDRIELNSLLLPLLTGNHQIMSYKERFFDKSRIPTIVQQ